jgi:hypothetical protein
MMKGHVKIELFDHKTGKLRTTERDNMLTNALAYRAGIDSNDTIALYSNENSLIPLGTKGLGGLLMFDGPLTEDAGNIHFPMNVHLTGCAGRGSGSPASSLQGTIDSAASGFINGKYTSVWNFLPNQGNGVIAALALTHAKAGATPFHMFRGNAWSTISTGYRHFVAMDPLTDTAYFSYNYQATSVITFYKRKLSRHLLRVNTPYLGAEETARSYSLTSEVITDRSYWDVTPDYDGYIYLCATQGNQTGNATVYLRRLKASADSFSLEEDEDFRQALTLPDVQLYPSNATKNTHTLALCVSNGYLYALSYDRKSVYRISLADTSQVRQFTPGIERFQMMDCGIYPHRDSGIWTEFMFQAITSTGGTENRRSRGVIYEDGECCCDTASYTTSSWSMKDFCGYVTDDLRMFTSYYVYFDACQNYIGTICNLEEPVTKTDSQSLKITYTITDA